MLLCVNKLTRAALGSQLDEENKEESQLPTRLLFCFITETKRAGENREEHVSVMASVYLIKFRGIYPLQKSLLRGKTNLL